MICSTSKFQTNAELKKQAEANVVPAVLGVVVVPVRAPAVGSVVVPATAAVDAVRPATIRTLILYTRAIKTRCSARV